VEANSIFEKPAKAGVIRQKIKACSNAISCDKSGLVREIQLCLARTHSLHLSHISQERWKKNKLPWENKLAVRGGSSLSPETCSYKTLNLHVPSQQQMEYVRELMDHEPRKVAAHKKQEARQDLRRDTLLDY